MDKQQLREEITQAVGLYSSYIMQDNPEWVFDDGRAIELVDQIMKITEETLTRASKPQDENLTINTNTI